MGTVAAGISAARPFGFGREHLISSPSATPPPLALPDAERALVAQMRAGDEDAFTHLFRVHYASLCTYAVRVVGDAEVAQDLVQGALFSVWKHRERWELRAGGTVRAYLYAAVRNVALQHRNHERVVHRVHGASAERGVPLALGEVGGPDDVLATRDLETAFAKGLAKLPPRCRQAFILRRAVGLSVAEVARVMGIAPKTVEVQISAALRALRAELRDWTGWSPSQPS